MNCQYGSPKVICAFAQIKLVIMIILPADLATSSLQQQVGDAMAMLGPFTIAGTGNVTGSAGQVGIEIILLDWHQLPPLMFHHDW
ncbi:hypothetical protein WL1483_3024 [Aeromonas schubertii]|uniref:Uncharacterized protein n=1 Tax=Aeromonas schubertii TaxID=652 RepID=A0A0S2SL76_9GAMM|nr:hypothetical protein WL1483_3024 [Aeromonas schubertii]